MSSKTAAALLSALLLALGSLAGCAHTGESKAAGTSATIEKVQEDLSQAEFQTESTENALDELLTSPYPDLGLAFTAFDENRKRMEMIGVQLLQHADGMHYKGEAYLTGQGAQAPACPIPAGSAGALQGAAKAEYFDAVAEEAWQVKRAYRAYQFDIEKLADYLGQQITPASVDNITWLIKKAKIDSESLTDALESAQGAIDAATTAAKAQGGASGG